MKNERPYEAEESLLADLQWLRHLAARLIQDPGLAEDACQEAWLLAGGTGELAGRRPALFRAMRRFAWRSNRSETRRRAREQQHAKSADLPSTAELIARGEERQILWRRLTELDEPYRTALLLKFQEGLATREIAARQGAQEDTVRRWIRRGLELLRERYKADRDGGGLESLALAALPLGLSSTSAPLAGAASSAQVATGGAGTSMSAAASSAAAILGAWIMKKSLIGIVLVVAALVLGNALLREPEDRGPALKAGSARASVELAAPGTVVTENLIPAPIEEVRTAVAASVPIEAEPEAESAVPSCRVYGRIVDAE
ncbi:MAG: RNA polymerase sigma factor, partial [Planctomycetota bacterium]